MSESTEPTVVIPEKADVTAIRHARSYSVEETDATAVVDRTSIDGALAEIMTRLYTDLKMRFGLPEIQQMFIAEPDRKMALRITLQLIDQGANEKEIRQLARIDLQAFDEFIERERPRLLGKTEKSGKPQ